MNTFYFNTGVKQSYNNLTNGQVWKNGVKQIPFDADAPKNASLLFLCDSPDSIDLSESTSEGIIVREVLNTVLLSKYAYFRVK